MKKGFSQDFEVYLQNCGVYSLSSPFRESLPLAYGKNQREMVMDKHDTILMGRMRLIGYVSRGCMEEVENKTWTQNRGHGMT